MAALNSSCGPTKIREKKYEKYIPYCSTDGMYFIKKVCQVFSHTDQFFQYRQILYGYKPINKLERLVLKLRFDPEMRSESGL